MSLYSKLCFGNFTNSDIGRHTVELRSYGSGLWRNRGHGLEMKCIVAWGYGKTQMLDVLTYTMTKVIIERPQMDNAKCY